MIHKISSTTIFSLAIFFALPALAAPSITGLNGQFAHEQSINISGSGFGAKTTATPSVWDNFESGNAGDAVEDKLPIMGPAWSIGASLGNPSYSSDTVRQGSQKSVYIPFGHNMYRNYLSIFSESDEYYFTFWSRFSSPESGDRNWKPYYIYPTSIPDLVPHQALGIWGPSGGGWRLSAASPDGTGDGFWGPGNELIDDIKDIWIRFEIYIKQSSPNQTDGATAVKIHYDYETPVIKGAENNSMKTRSDDAKYGTINIGEYYGSGGSVATVYLDDVYFDTTRSRIEIGDAPIWDSCTHREIQIPSAWSESSVAFTVNQGSFSSGEQAYLFVVDENGDVSEGYPITFAGSSEDTTPPASPSGLIVS